MKKYFVVLTLIFSVGCHHDSKNKNPKDLTIYTYDSLIAKGGLGEVLFPAFEKKCGCHLKILPSGNAEQMLSRAEIDFTQPHPSAQILIGIDQYLWPRTKKIAEEIHVEGIDTDRVGFFPYDYGVFTFMMDTKALREKKLPLPHSLNELLAPRWKKLILLEDPRTSTPGLVFALFAEKILSGDKNFWKNFSKQWLTLTPGWSQAYGLFMKESAPLVWSYTTSEAYHRAHGDSSGRYQAMQMDEGNPTQIEGAMLVKNSFSSEAQHQIAIAFMKFLQSDEIQKQIPEKNWMLPVIATTELPPAFETVSHPKKIIALSAPANLEEFLKRWHEDVTIK